MDKPEKTTGNGQLPETELLDIARKVLYLESEALTHVRDRLGEPFLEAVHCLDGCRGKVVITGLGKSGIAGKKIAATLSSTGVPSLFLHAGEANHGDLGVVSKGDVVLALSYSGETHELVEIIPRFKVLGVPVIAMTGSTSSVLANLADVVLDVSVPQYPWPFGLLPTASNAVTVAIGDALAVTLLVARGVKEEDFAQFHPGGLLGRKILVKVCDLMHTGEELPVVDEKANLRLILMEMTAKRLGVACVTNSDGRLRGIITDGDLRRLLERESDPLDRTANEIMTVNPKTITPDVLAAKALHIMESHSITSLAVLDNTQKLIGVIHIHDILKLETG